VGDLGNLLVKNDGTCTSSLTIDFVQLQGRRSVMGRSLVIHESIDDLGKGGDAESLKTGNAGARIGCAVIGYAQKSKLYF
jgi:Cu-Zn family superoxide dismutase